MTAFEPKPGQIDFTDARWAPVISCVVACNGKILIVKRSAKMRIYPGRWNGIGGFLDDNKNLEEKVREELFEEIGIKENEIKSIKLGDIFDADDPTLGKTWIVHPVIAEVETEKIVLDWEAEEYKWINPGEVENFDVAPGFRKVVRNFLKEFHGA